MTKDTPTLLWQPSPERIAQANLTRFIDYVNQTWQADASDYASLYDWSIREPEQFWQSIWSFCGVIGEMGAAPYLLDGDKMPGARWFPQARLNFAENLLRRHDSQTAIVFWGESAVRRKMTYGELHSLVSRTARAMRALGVSPGDRVAGFMPNMPEAIAAMLATTSIGAIWSSCSPDFGVQGVLDRFGQIEPKVLFCVDGY
jgi:acetoacetyl-CoA synthetase